MATLKGTMLMAAPVHLPLEDFPVDGPGSDSLYELLGAHGMRVPRMATHPAGLCYWNVCDLVAREHGSMELGWMIEWLPNEYIQAMHHAIWVKSDGSRVDVTAPQSRMPTNGITTFVPDGSGGVDLGWPVLRENRHIFLSDDPNIREAINQYTANIRLMGDFYRDLRALRGYSWSPIRGLQGPPFPENLKHYDVKLRQTYAAMHAARSRYLSMSI